MSQVRKLQTGGKTTYGHLIIDGIDHGNSEETYRQFSEHAKLQDSRQGAAYAKWLQDLREGKDVILDVDNTASSHPDDMSDKRAGNRSYLRKVFDDIGNTNRNVFSDAIYTARQFIPVKTPVKKKSHSNDSSWFIFNGQNNKYDPTAIGNLGINDRFNSYLDWLSMDNWEDANEFTSKLTDQQKTNLKAWYNSLNGATPEEKRQAALSQWNANLDKVKQVEGGYNNVDDSTKEFFSNFNIGGAGTAAANGASGSSPVSNTEKEIRDKLRNSGYNEDLYNLLGDNFELGSDGVWRAKAGSFDFGLGDGGIYFNDDFYRSTYGADGRYNPLKGLTYYNGAIYKNDNPTLAQILNASGGYNDLVKSGDFMGADRIIRTRFTPEEMENPGVLGQDDYSSYIQPGMQFSNLTGLYTLNDGSMRDGEQLIQYIDLNDPTQDGPYAKYNYRFALLDDRGNLIRDNINRENLSKIVGGTQAGNLLTYKKVTRRGSGKYANKYYEDITGKNGQPSGIRIYRDINNPNSDVILHVDDLPGFANGKDVALPKEVAEILMEDQSWVEKIVGNAQARKNFANMLHSLGESKFTKAFDNWWDYTTPTGLWRDTFDVDYQRNRLKTFMNKDQIKRLQKALSNASKGNRFDRREQYFIEAPEEFKNGGKVAYITKLAGGGFAGGNKSSQGVTEKRINQKVQNPKNASSLAEIGKEGWTDADTTDLVALGADLASLTLAFTPGTNVASTVTGVASSLARYTADKSRGTTGAGASLALNLGMDAATLLPFIGGAAKAGKITKAVKAALPTIIKAASVYGLGSAVVTSAKKIANGEKFTVRDVSNVVNGITAGVGVAKSGGFGRSTKKISELQDMKITGKDGKSLEIKADKLANVSSKQELFDVAFAEAKKSDAKLTEDAFVKNFGSKLETFIKSKWTPGWNPKNWTKTSKTGKLKLETKSKTQAIEANGNKFHDWWYGVGDRQLAYKAAMTNDAKRASLRKTTGGAKSSRVVWDGKSWTPVSTRQVPVRDGGWAMSSVSSSAGGANPNNLPAVIQNVTVPVPTRQMQTRITLNTQTRTVPVIRRNGVRFDRNFYNLAQRQGLARPQLILTHPRTDNEYQEPFGMVRNPLFKKGGVLKYQNGSYVKYGDNNIDTSRVLGDLYKKGLAAAEYAVKARYRKKVTDDMAKAIVDSNYHTPYVQYNMYSTANPKADAQIAYLQQQNRTDTIPRSADYVAQLAGQLTKQKNIYDALETATRSASAEYSAIDKANTEIANKQHIADQQIAAENLARDAGMRMELGQNKASYDMQTGMSKANALRELRANAETELAKASQFAFNNAAQNLDAKYERGWNGKLGDYYNKWMALDSTVRDQYSDINDWMQRAPENKGVWSNYETAWNQHQNALNNEKLKLYARYNLSPSAEMLYRQRYGYGYKRGGRIGRNRYKNEPEEDVWIEQNKAVHKQVAKFNDNIIKIFLKTLK